MLGSVPQREAGTAGGELITAQRVGAAIGIAVVGTALFGSGSGESGSSKVTPSLVSAATGPKRTPDPCHRPKELM